MGEWILFTNGAFNHRRIGIRVILKSSQGNILPQTVSCEFDVTNNEAQYEELIMGMQLAKD